MSVVWIWQRHDTGIARGGHEDLSRPCRYVVRQYFRPGSQLPELVHLEMRQQVSNIIVDTSNMGNTYINIITADTKYNKRTKPMVWGARVEPWSQISTTAWLSQWNKIFWRDQKEPHVWTATTITNSSFQVISMLAWDDDQWDRINLPFQYAPHPCTPEASV